MESNNLRGGEQLSCLPPQLVWARARLAFQILRKLRLKFRRRTLITLQAGKPLRQKTGTPAIKSFSSAAKRNPRNADIQNYLGYAYRKTGKLDLAFTHYNLALALNPRHRGAHEYIGEAYLIKGDLKSAQKHLAALREICSLPCEELTDLEREIEKYVKKPAAADHTDNS